ncbi:MAG: sugar phosphate isomerase/epimerase [Ruminococcaceae bacterium]|nr:sugar phosphate isomerase/epimerase [Oscillospiraceae bacterium]
MLLFSAVTTEAAAPSKVAVFQGPLEETVRRAKEAGFDAVQLTARVPEDLPKEKLLRLSAETGIVFSAVANGKVASVDGLTLNSSDPEKRAACVERLCTLADRAAEIGRPVTVIGMIRGNRQHAGSPEESLRNFGESIRAVAAHCEKVGIDVAIESYNHEEANMYYTPEAVAELLREVGSPRLRMSLDLMHLFIEELDIPETIRKYAPYCRQIDITGENRCSPRESSMDFPAICRAIVESGFDGTLNFEYAAQDAAADLAYIRKLLDKA